MLELRQFASVGRSLVASQRFYPGEEVVNDTCAMRWDAGAPLPDAVAAAAAKYSTLQPVLVSAVHAFASRAASDSSAVRTVLDMHVPELPISRGTVELLSFCRDYASLFSEAIEALSVSAPKDTIGAKNAAGDAAVLLAHAAMAAKVNSHRATNGDWCLFPTASKLAHSCEPNLFFVPPTADGTCRFVATRQIETGELLSFSYVGGPLLASSCFQRQQRLLSSHLFLCKCRRCEGRDWCRQFRCPARCADPSYARGVSHVGRTAAEPPLIARLSSSLAATDDDAFPRKLWRCRSCQSEFTDVDLKGLLLVEKDIVADVEAIDPSKYKLADLKDLALEAAAELGYGHHASAAMAFHMMSYFRLMNQNGVADALPAFMVWAGRYLDALALMRVETAGTEGAPAGSFVHMLSASAIQSIAAVVGKCPASAQRDRFLPATIALAATAQQLLSAVHPGDARTVAIKALAAQASTLNTSVDMEAGAAPYLCDVARQLVRFWPEDYRPHIGCWQAAPSGPGTPPSASVVGPAGTDENDHGMVLAANLWDRIVARRQLEQALHAA
jgi:hypothetical protein